MSYCYAMGRNLGIKEKGFNNVKQVLDPTLLLNNEEWSSLAEKTKLDGKEYILVYQLHHNKQMEDYLKKLKKRNKTRKLFLFL